MMRSAPVRVVLHAGLLAVLAACAGPRTLPAQNADDLLLHGDYDGAVVRYALDLARNPGDERTASRLETARDLAWNVHRERAAAALERSDLATAEAELERTLELDPGDEEAATRLREVRAERDSVGNAVDRAEKLLRAGDADGAIQILTPLRARFGAAPRGAALLREAETRVRDEAVEAASAALRREEFGAARDHAKRAAGILPVAPRAAELLAESEIALEAEALAKDARARLRAGDYLAAIAGFRAARSRRPSLSAAASGLREARTAGARANLEAAAGDIERGQFARALQRLETARELDPDTAADAGIAGDVRGRLGRDLLARGRTHLAAGRPALALLYLDRAREARDDLAGLAASEAEARDATDAVLRRRIRIDDLTDASAGPGVDALGIGRAAVARMRATGLLPWISIEIGPDADSAPAVLSGEVTEFRVRRSPPVRKVRTVRYVASVAQDPNPEHERLERDLRRAEWAEREEALRLAAHRRHLRTLVENPWDAWHLDRRGPARGGVPETVRAGYDSAVLLQRARLRSAERRWNDAVDLVARLGDELARTPTFIERPIHAIHRYTQTTRTTSGRAVVTLTLAVPDAGAIREEAYDGYSLTDTEAAGFEPAGLAPDPDDLPDGEDARARLATGLVSKLSDRMRTVLESLALHHLDGIDALEADERHERWARFLLSGVPGSERTRETIRLALREETGLIVPSLPASIREEGQ